MKLVLDIETNGIDNPTQVWCVVTEDVDTNEVKEWTYETGYEGLRDYLHLADNIIGHHIISYDAVWLDRLLGIKIDDTKLIDTLILSKLWHFGVPDGHSLEAWGKRLKHPKVGLDLSFDSWSIGIIDRCRNDVRLNLNLYNWLSDRLKPKDFERAIDVEHRMAVICRGMHEAGFGFNILEAQKIHGQISSEVADLDKSILEGFPPQAKLIREITPRLTRHGTLARTGLTNWYSGNLSIFSPGSPFSLVEWIPFNPGSPKQIVSRLNAIGWKPTDRTDGYFDALSGCKRSSKGKTGNGRTDHQKLKTKEQREAHLKHMEEFGWKVNETNLATIPEDAPEAAKLLLRRVILASRLRTLNEWMEFYNASTGRIHGRFNSIGARTQRMSHSNPNMGNVAAKKSIKYNSPELKKLAIDLGGRMRSLWCAGENKLLVGTDMESAHLRIFAHLINDEEFTHSLLKGRKEDGTDPHSLNARKVGLPDRDKAKTFIFSFINGCGPPKVAEIANCSLQEGSRILREFTEAYPGLRYLKSSVFPEDARRGYFRGLDGRLVACAEERLLIGAYLQNYEAVLMKYSNVEWQDVLLKEAILFKQVNLVHDEFITEVEGSRSISEEVGRIQADSIRRVGEQFSLRCPLGGEYKIGKTWLDVH